MKVCYYCKSDKEETRPYGPNGADVCFGCAFATPEREKQTEEAFQSMMEKAIYEGDGIVVIGTDEGPQPGDSRLL